VKLAIKTAAIAGGLLAAFLAAGCTAGAPAGGAPGGPGPASVSGCTAYGVYAIEHHITVTWTPTPCRGLSRAELNQAAAAAILRVAGGAPKPVWRRRAARVAPFLNHLITGPAPVAGSVPAGPAWSGSGAPVSASVGGQDLGLDIAALVAWLITAGSGAYVLGAWISHGGSLRPRSGAPGSPPIVIFGHFGLALCGLALWVVYLIVGWAALAWAAVGVLLPVAGLGMATLVIGFPGRAPALAASGGRPPGESIVSPVGAAAAGTRTTSIGTLRSATVRSASVGAVGAASIGRMSARGRLSPLVVVGHGLLAVTTILLVLLAALGTAAG